MITIASLIIGSMAPLWTNNAMIDPAAPPPQKGQVFIVKNDGESSGPKTLLFKRGANIEPGGPWLGIQFGPVSKATSAQLHLSSGQMVINIHEGSPADQAGLQQYDVITAIDGQNVSSSIEEFLGVVRGYKPGEAHTLSLVRGGQPTQITLTVGTRPEEIGAAKFKSDDADLSQGQVFNRGGMLQKDDNGNWVFKGFNIPDMPDVWKALPNPGDHELFFNFPVPGGAGNKTQMFFKKDSGKSIRIERADDGKITVNTTVNENGKETTTTKTYANEDELKTADADAAQMLGEGPQLQFQFLPGGGAMNMDPLDPDMKAKIEEAMKNAHEAMKNGQGGAMGFAFGDPANAGNHVQVFSRKARTSFEVTPDGKVKVTTRKGDDEITNVYDNAEALRQANPDQYKKFERLQESGQVKN